MLIRICACAIHFVVTSHIILHTFRASGTHTHKLWHCGIELCQFYVWWPILSTQLNVHTQVIEFVCRSSQSHTKVRTPKIETAKWQSHTQNILCSNVFVTATAEMARQWRVLNPGCPPFWLHNGTYQKIADINYYPFIIRPVPIPRLCPQLIGLCPRGLCTGPSLWAQR